MRKKLLIFLALAIVCAGIGWYWVNKPRSTAASKSTDVSITAQGLYDAYNTNENSANKSYLNKVVEVKGTVDDIADADQDAIVTLGLQPTGGGVSCRFTPAAEFKDKKIQKGTEITIKGTCTGFNMDVNLTDCVIIL